MKTPREFFRMDDPELMAKWADTPNAKPYAKGTQVMLQRNHPFGRYKAGARGVITSYVGPNPDHDPLYLVKVGKYIGDTFYVTHPDLLPVNESESPRTMLSRIGRVRQRFSVGSVVRSINFEHESGNQIGKVVEVTFEGTESKHAGYMVDFGNEDVYIMLDSELEPAVEEAATPREVLGRARTNYDVGDKVRVVTGEENWNEGDVGTVREVVKPRVCYGVGFEGDDEGTWWPVSWKDLEPAETEK